MSTITCRSIAMSVVSPVELPVQSLLQACRARGAFTDAYVTVIDGAVSHTTFIEAFYTTRLFKVERAILKWLAARPSSDVEAKRLAEGATESFAAWRVEVRTADQLLLADFTGRTKSWLMTVPMAGSSGQAQSHLYFGSAVVPRRYSASGVPRMGFGFHLLLGFHRMYSRWLLGAARSAVMKASSSV